MPRLTKRTDPGNDDFSQPRLTVYTVGVFDTNTTRNELELVGDLENLGMVSVFVREAVVATERLVAWHRKTLIRRKERSKISVFQYCSSLQSVKPAPYLELFSRLPLSLAQIGQDK